MFWLLPVASMGQVALAVGSIDGVIPELPPELLELPLDPEPPASPDPLEPELACPPELPPDPAPLSEPDPVPPELEPLAPLLPELVVSPVPLLPPEPPGEPPLEPLPRLGEDGEPLHAVSPTPRATTASVAMHVEPRSSCDFMGFILR
jgi:hypothetical protein